MYVFILNYFEGHFMPHGHCYFWRPDILWANVIGDALTTIAYFSIPILLIYFLKHREDIKFKGIFYLFAIFILSCGITHTLAIISVWNPIYAIEGIAKLFTGSVSIITAVVLFRKIPLALKIPSPEKMELVNLNLKNEIKQRESAEKQMLDKALALENSNDYLRQLTYSTSHDLKEPIRNITLLTQRFQRKYGSNFNEDEKDNFEIIISEGKRMLKTIESLKNINYLETLADPMSKVSLAICLENAKDHLKNEGKDISVIQENELQFWNCYPVLITELFKQLLSNAIKFNNSISPEVKISSSIENSVLTINFEDNGVGFDPIYSERIFRMFEKLDGQQKYPGPGLGLSISKKIINIHGGNISAKSTIGKGSTFTIKLPEDKKSALN